MPQAPALSIVPTPSGVTVRPGGVTAPVDSAVTNSCVKLTLSDQTQFNAFVSGLEAQGTKFDVPNHLTVRFFIRT